MRVDASTRRWRRCSAFVQLALFAFSASTSLLPCANEMAASAPGPATTAHHATAPSHATHASETSPVSAAQHHAPTAPPSSDACPWVVGCTGMVQFAFESTLRLLETTPVVSAPIGVTLRAVYAERDVESPPPRA
jgi:hypothetical protein